jgi:hypothetical protein
MRSSTASFIGTWLLVLAGASVAASAADETARINAWLDAKYEEQLDLSPMARSYAGEKRTTTRSTTCPKRREIGRWNGSASRSRS